MAIGSPVVYADFSGGVNKEAGPYLLQENQCQDARNVTATVQGSLEKRAGFSSFSTIVNGSAVAQLDGRAHSLAAANLAGGQYLLAVGKTPAASTDRIVSISASGVAEAIHTGPTLNTRWEFVQAPIDTAPTPDQGPIYGINGIDTPQYWAGTTASTAMADWTAVNDLGNAITPHPAKPCKYLVYHLDKLWASGDVSNPGRIYSTGVDSNGFPNPRNWDSSYTDDIEPADGQQITGIGKVGPYLLVFKNKKTYVLTDPANRAYRTISSSIGCAAHRSIVETTNGTLFLSEDLGVCITDGTSVSAVSGPLESFLRDIATSQPLNLAYAAGAYFEDSYYLSVPYQGSTNSLTVQYHLPTQSWWLHTCASNQFALLDPTGTPKLYSAAPGARRVERAFDPAVFEDASGPYEAYWDGPFWAWGDPHINKRLHQLRADGEGVWQFRMKGSFTEAYSGALDEQVWENNDVGATAFGQGSLNFGDANSIYLYGAGAGVVQKRYPTPTKGWGRAWSLRISDSKNNAALKLYSVAAFTRRRAD